MNSADENPYIGPEWRFPVEEGKVREFAKAVRDPGADRDPIRVPPTFPSYGAFAYAPERVVHALGLDVTRVLHGGEEYRYTRTLHVGDVLRCRTRVVDEFLKQGRRGGELRFIVSRTEMRDFATGDLVVEVESTLIALGDGDGDS